ncbi:hypothetical protein [Methylosinus sp. RM1]|uniref:hypothetical protein n=1 Tax=Methylosinus sp. RM1 TaxID=2583817 RepID=UPI00140A496D|nr:hypothetical protein [Methylosinus sp. RM1]
MNNKLEALIATKAETSGEYANAYAGLQIAQALDGIAYQLKRLGLSDASTPLGAIEALSKSIQESANTIATAIITSND